MLPRQVHACPVVSEGRAAVAAAQSDAGSARAAAAAASAERDAILISALPEHAYVRGRIVELERQLAIERALNTGAPSASQAARARQPARPKPPVPETFIICGQMGTPPSTRGASPRTSQAANTPAGSQRSDPMPVGTYSAMHNLVGNHLAAITSRLEALRI